MNLISNQTSRRVGLLVAVGALSIFFAAGCLVGPDFRRPDQQMPEGWTSLTTHPTGPAATQVSIVTAGAAQTVLWWQAFDDRTLERLIREALDQNLNVVQAIARLKQARAQRAIATGQLWPNVDLNGDYRRSGGGDNNGRYNNVDGISSRAGSRDLYAAGFDATWEIDIFGALRRGVEAADATVQASVADLQDVRVSLAAEVAVDYFSLRAAQQRLVIAEKNLQTQRQSRDITERQFKNGFVAGLDLANAEAQVATTESQIPSLQSSARQSMFDLALLLGREPDSLVDALSPGANIPTTPPQIPVGLPSDLLRRRPDVRRAEAQLHAATAQIGVATADLFPRFSLSGSFGAQGARANRVFSWGNTTWSIGPSISWNVFDAGRIRAGIILAEGRQDELVAAYKQTVLTAMRDVEQALTSYDYEQRRRLKLMAAVEANTRAVRIAQALYDKGQTEFVNLLTAQRDLLSTEDAMVQSDAQVASNLVTIYKALGGGWEETATPPNTVPTAPAPGIAQTQPAPFTKPPPASEPATQKAQ